MFKKKATFKAALVFAVMLLAGITASYAELTLSDIPAPSQQYTTPTPKTYYGHPYRQFGPHYRPPGDKFENDEYYAHNGVVDNVWGLTVNNVLFYNNFAFYGGAIFNQANLTIADSIFEQNLATYSGGAISNHNVASIVDTLFLKNTATQKGGAIYNEGLLGISGITFQKNRAEQGGALYLASGSVLATMNTIKFDENVADKGGALYNNVANLTLSGMEFNKNSAFHGGAIYNNGTNLTIDNTVVLNNNFAVEGGAVYNNNTLTTDTSYLYNAAMQGGAIYNKGTLTVNPTNSVFDYNSAGNGGAIYNSGTMTIDDIAFNYNSAGNGGAIYNTANNLTIDNAAFYGNDAILGGAIFNANDTNLNALILDNVVLQNNGANDGGAIYNIGRLEIYNSGNTTVISANNATANGGAIYNDEDAVLTIDATTNDITFTGNSANGQANDIYNDGNITLNGGNITMDGGFSGTNTNALIQDNSSNLTITGDNSSYQGNYTKDSGALNLTGRAFGQMDLNTNTTTNIISAFVDYSAALHGNAQLSHKTTSYGNNSTGFKRFYNANGASITYDKDASLIGRANYTLAENTYSGADVNTITFQNSNVKVDASEFATAAGNTHYTFTNSTVDLVNNSNDAVAFTTLSAGTGAKVSVDMTVGANAGNLDITGNDTINATNATGQFGIENIKIRGDQGAIANSSDTATIFTSNGAFSANSFTIATTAHTYTASTGAGNRFITLNKTGDTTNTTLAILNQTANNRIFTFSGTGETYTVAADLGTTNAGTFIVQGYDSNAANSILDADGKSLFNTGANNVNLTLKDLTIQNASNNGANIGSVVNNSSGLGLIVIDNVVIKDSSTTLNNAAIQTSAPTVITNSQFLNNTSTGGGGTSVLMTGGNTDIENTLFKNNTSDGDSGAVLIGVASNTKILSGTKFDNNYANTSTVLSAGAINSSGNLQIIADKANIEFTDNSTTSSGGAGAIMNSGNLTLTSTNSGDIVFSGNTINNATGSPTDTNAIANDINLYLNTTLNIDGEGGTVTSNGGIIGDNTAVINKTGRGTLTFGANSLNENYSGAFNQSAGTTNVKGTFFGGISTITGGILNWLGADKKSSAELKVTNNGILQIGDGTTAGAAILTLNNDNDILAPDARINITSGSTLVVDMDNSTNNVVINNNDIWNGTLINKDQMTFSNYQTNHTGSYVQGAGAILTIADKSNFGLGSGSISGGQVHVDNSTLYLNNSTFTGGNVYTYNSSTINAVNNKTGKYTFDELNIVGASTPNFLIDINPAAKTADKFIIGNATSVAGPVNINLQDINIIGNTPKKSNFNFKLFDIAQDDGNIDFAPVSAKIRTPYYLSRLSSIGGGMYNFQSYKPNPQIFRGQVATLASFNNQQTINNLVLNHTHLASEEWLTASTRNQYAAVLPQFAPYQYSREDGSIWFKPYGTFETLNMTQGLNVHNNAYGALIGADMPAIKLKEGWKFLPSGYVGYNGGHQTFEGVSMFQNGGQVGAMGTWMKEDFIGSWLAYGGTYYNEMSLTGTNGAPYHDETLSWFLGTALKGAYNFHPTESFIIQPNLLASYNYFSTQRWHSNYGAMSMTSGMLNGVNIAPGVNFILAKETWSTYLTFQYMYNINDKLDGRAGFMQLPNVRMRHGYIEYGIGVTKKIKDRWSSYLQVALRNGGRTGVGFQFGLSYKL